MRTTTLAMLLMILLSSFVLAKGSSSYRNPESVLEPLVIDCNSKDILQERIQCRLENGGSATVPEACAGLTNAQECTEFYNRAGYCYDLAVDKKDACFQKESGYAADPSSDAAKRFYINALLYELEEYTEDQYDDGELTVVLAAELVSDIVRIKRFLLSGRELSFISEKVDDYAQKKGI